MRTPGIRSAAQGALLAGGREPPGLRLPDPKSFSARAARFAMLAAGGHADAPFLRLMERLARAQQKALDAHPEPAGPDASRLEACRRHGLPPLGKDGARSPAWRQALASIVEDVRVCAPAPAQRAMGELQSARPDVLEGMAERLLAFDYPGLDPAAVPFLGAALQVHWLKRAAALGAQAFSRLDMPNLCPVCGAPPVASALRFDVPVPGLRYLRCALCGADWQLARGQCTQCQAREKVAYFHLEGGNPAVKAEACDACRSYVKILDLEKDARAEPVADDLATLALDVLMDDSGYRRATPNLLFVPGPA